MKKRSLAITLIVALLVTVMPVMEVSAATAKKPGTPKITSAKVSENYVTLKWSKAKNAKTYQVYKAKGTTWKYWKTVKKSQAGKYGNSKKYKLKKSGSKYMVYRKANKYAKVASVKSTSYKFKGDYAASYTFMVRAYNGKKAGADSAAKTVRTAAKPAAEPVAETDQTPEAKPEQSPETKPGKDEPAPAAVPGKVTGVKATVSDNTITVTWDKLPEAASYKLYYKRTQNNGYKIKTLTKTSFRLGGCAYDTAYTFKVYGINAEGVGGPFSDSVNCTTPVDPSTLIKPVGAVSNLKVALKENGMYDAYTFSLTASWSVAENAETYDVFVTEGTGSGAVTYRSTTSGCSYTYNTSLYSTQFTFKVVPKSSDSSGTAGTVSCTTPEEVIEVKSVSSSIYYYGKTAPVDMSNLNSTVRYDTNSLTYNSASELVRGETGTYGLIPTPLVENNYFVLSPTVYTNKGTSKKFPVTWTVKENTIGATTEVRGRNLIIKTPKYTSREQARGRLIIELSSGEVKEIERRFVAAFPEFIMPYNELLSYPITPDLRRALTVMDLEQNRADTNREIEALVQSLIKGCTTDRQKVGRIIEWFHNNIEYRSSGSSGIQTVYGTWVWKYAVCGGMAKLLAQMIRYADIPAGACDIPSVNHACTFFWLEGEWYTTDGTTFEKNTNLTSFSGENYMAPISKGLSGRYSGFNIKKGYLTSTGNWSHVAKYINGTWVSNWDLVY